MKKRTISNYALSFLCIVIGMLLSTLSASASFLNVYDSAELLTVEQEEYLADRLQATGDKYGAELFIITVDSYGGEDPDLFAESVYDRLTASCAEDNGALIVFNTGKGDGDRNLAFFAEGEARKKLTDSKMNKIFDRMIPDMTAGEYTYGFESFIDGCDEFLSGGFVVPLEKIPLALIIGVVLALVIVGIQASKLKNVYRKHDAADYVENVTLTGRSDRFLYSNVTKIPIPKNNTKSSGGSRGGRNRSF